MLPRCDRYRTETLGAVACGSGNGAGSNGEACVYIRTNFDTCVPASGLTCGSATIHTYAELKAALAMGGQSLPANCDKQLLVRCAGRASVSRS